MKLKRDPQAVLSTLIQTPSGQVIAKENCKIQVPVRFSEGNVGLGQVGIQTFTYGLFPIILENGSYSVCNVNAIIELDPFKTLVVTLGDTDYHEFYFEPGSVIIKSLDLVQREAMMFNVMDEFIFKGKIPWYVEYDDLGHLFDTAKQHANSNVAQNPEVIEFIASLITRSKQDRTKYIRNVAEKYSDFSLDKIDYIPLSNVFYSAHSTVNKLAGSYFNDGVISALVTPSENVEQIEKILRS